MMTKILADFQICISVPVSDSTTLPKRFLINGYIAYILTFKYSVLARSVIVDMLLLHWLKVMKKKVIGNFQIISVFRISVSNIKVSKCYF